MTVEEKVQVILLANAALAARVPSTQIKTPGDWQGLATPYIVHQPVAGQIIHTHDGIASLRIWDFYEVSIYAATHKQARMLGDLVVAALDGYEDSEVDRIALSNPPTAREFDSDRKVAQVTLDFEIAGDLT